MLDNQIEKHEPANTMADLVQRYADSLDDEQLRVLPLLGYGMSVNKTAELTGIQSQRIRSWIQTSYHFRQSLSDFRENVKDYHTAMLNQAATLAWDVVFEFLSTEYDNPKDKTMQASIAQFVISQLGLKTVRSEVKHEIEPQLHVTEDSAALIAKKLKDLQSGNSDTIDAEYRISVDSPDGASVYNSMETAKALDNFYGNDPEAEIKELETNKNSEYVTHPELTYGVLDFNEDTSKWRCHICGSWTSDLVVHIRTAHKLSPSRYKKMYGLPESTVFYLDKPREATAEEIKDFNDSVSE